jgi:hypothetical protein
MLHAAGTGPWRRRLGLLVSIASVACIWTAPPALAGSPPYKVGAARVDVTPPLITDHGATPSAFGICPSAVYSGPRQWAFEEPYIDTDSSGDFNYPNGEPEPYCDANHNGRWEGIYISGGVDHPASVDHVHDPIDARAIAIGDGTHTVVIVSVVAQGLFENYIRQWRSEAEQLRPGINNMVVSANHNESSPDTIGIYGAPPVPEDIPVLGGAVGENSGINEYYMQFLGDQVAKAAAAAFDDRRAASLWTTEFQVNEENDGKPELPPGVHVELSNNFPTTNDDQTPAAVDPKVRVLQARDTNGDPIATVMNLAAHNQEIGHGDDAPYDISSDWPGYFHDRLEQDVGGGMAMFLVGDNGSEEDPKTDPSVDCTGQRPCYDQAEATGHALADAVAAALPDATEIRGGAVSARRTIFFAPLENNLFKAAAGAGLFGTRQLYTNGVPSGRTGEDLRTSVEVVNVGPDLQFLGNPGEAFPALMVGSPWGIEDVACPERPNPPVPAWHASATHRFEIGLADDMIGYEEPAWAFTSLPGAFNYSGPPDNGGPASCTDDLDDKDSKGHQHKLETEGAGPTASNLVANHLTDLLKGQPDPVAHIRLGRYVYADGTVSRRPQRPDGGGGTEDAVAVWLADPNSTALTPTSGTIVAVSPTGEFGDRLVDTTGEFMDYDGQGQGGAPDITTRGMLTGNPSHPSERFYLNVYPSLDVSTLGHATAFCDDVAAPTSAPDRGELKVHDARLRAGGSASDQGCAGDSTHAPRDGEVERVQVAVSRRMGTRRCRYLDDNGRLGPAGPCRPPHWLDADGTESWNLTVRLDGPLPRGHYRLRSRATDGSGNREPRSTQNTLRFRVR